MKNKQKIEYYIDLFGKNYINYVKLRKKLVFNIKLEAQEAKAIAPLSPTLGQYGLSTLDFCKEFNDRTKEITIGVPLRVQLFVMPDRKFYFVLKNVEFVSLISGAEFSFLEGVISLKNLYRLCKIYIEVYGNNVTIESAILTIMGTMDSLGYKTVFSYEDEDDEIEESIDEDYVVDSTDEDPAVDSTDEIE